MQNWKKYVNIPLRLDIYYEYQIPSIDNDDKVSFTTRKELLERWCIDYLPTFDSSSPPNSYNNNNNNNNFPNQFNLPQQPPTQQQSQMKRSNSLDETILQLRQVVKHVIIFLRVLNSFTRLMPGYKLHHALMLEKFNPNYYQQQQPHHQQHGGPGLRGGYYKNPSQPYHQQQQQQQQHHHHNQQQQQPSQPTASHEQHLIGGKIKFLFCVSSDSSTATTTATAASLSSNPSSDNYPQTQHDLNLDQQRLFSSTTNHPFTRHDMNPIPTPYGVLHLTALYDESLNVKRVMMDRRQRLMVWNDMCIRLGRGGVNGGNHRNDHIMMTKAIPIQIGQNQNIDIGNTNDHYDQHTNRVGDEYDHNGHHQQQEQQQQQRHRHSYHPSNMHQSNGMPQPMSLPNPTVSDNILSNHLIHNYAQSPVMNNQQYNMTKDKMDSGMQNKNQAIKIRDRLDSDPGINLSCGSGGMKPRVLSGLSLALANDGQQEHQQQQEQQKSNSQDQHRFNNTNSLSSSPQDKQYIQVRNNDSGLTIPESSSEEAAIWKQRLALHHPPPSFDSNIQLQQTTSSSPQSGSASFQKYGYGYNQGKAIPIPNALQQQGDRCPSPNMLHTPPKPVFINSYPRKAEIGVKEVSDDTLSPPFCNPMTLQDVPPSPNSPLLSKSTLPLPQRQFQSIGLSGMLQSNNGRMPSSNVAENLLLPPLTTMDELVCSPFKIPLFGCNSVNGQSALNNSAFSSLTTLGRGSAMAFGHDGDDSPLALTSGVFSNGGGLAGGGMTNSIGYNSSLLGQGERIGSDVLFRSNSRMAMLHNQDDDNKIEDMPFALAENDNVMNSPKYQQNQEGLKSDIMNASSETVSSQVVTSFAHKCATASRLKLFEKTSASYAMNQEQGSSIDIKEQDQDNDNANNMAILSSQLDDLKSFGESIMSST